MEGELWNELYPVICILGKRFRARRVQISNTTVVLVYAWAVLHDRPVSWACQAANWPPEQRPSRLPSPLLGPAPATTWERRWRRRGT